ncbi:MAG: hypothetical protein ACRC5M_07195, partial [Anaeroplasmataceae bacterium]
MPIYKQSFARKHYQSALDIKDEYNLNIEADNFYAESLSILISRGLRDIKLSSALLDYYHFIYLPDKSKDYIKDIKSIMKSLNTTPIELHTVISVLISDMMDDTKYENI